MRRAPDHFSDRAAAYAAHRPTYPTALVAFLADLAPARGLAWDAGCGSGQLSIPLTAGFDRVVGTDMSAAQIAEATSHPSVSYRVALAEASGLPDDAVDLAVAAQAAHWFDLDAYYGEVRRVTRPRAIIALVSYGLVRVREDIDPIVRRFYAEVLGPYWPPQRRHVEDGYRSLPFPFDEIEPPGFETRARWTLAEFLGYVRTWSAVRALERAQGVGPLEHVGRALRSVWGAADTRREVIWTLAVRIGRV